MVWVTAHPSLNYQLQIWIVESQPYQSGNPHSAMQKKYCGRPPLYPSALPNYIISSLSNFQDPPNHKHYKNAKSTKMSHHPIRKHISYTTIENTYQINPILTTITYINNTFFINIYNMTYKKEIIHIQYVIIVAYNTINAKAV